MKTKNLILTLALVICTSYAFAQISGTDHDFSGETWAGYDMGVDGLPGGGDDTAGQICIACHTPHNANIAGQAASAPLWNRTETKTGTFTAYSSATFDADDAGSNASYDGANPNGSSLLCLTCHDGVGDLDAFGANRGNTGTTVIAAGAVRNGGLDEHPFSFIYSTDLVTNDSELHAQATVNTAGLLDATFRVQCASCHDVHNANNYNGGAGLLVMDNAGSALCLTCHNK